MAPTQDRSRPLPKFVPNLGRGAGGFVCVCLEIVTASPVNRPGRRSVRVLGGILLFKVDGVKMDPDPRGHLLLPTQE